MKDFFQDLFAYNHETNQKLAEYLQGQSTELPEKVLSLFSHNLNAHHIWNHRIEGKPTRHGVWELHPTGSFKEIDNQNHQDTLGILSTHDLHERLHYSNSRGDAFENTVRDILFHIINHSTHHRAQIATAFREAGIEPLATDYIFFRRN